MPKIVDHDLARADLLDRAFLAFAVHGYAALSMRSLASELKASTGTLYHYFDSKQALFSQMVQRVAQADAAEALAAIPNGTDATTTVQNVVEFVQTRDEHLRRLLRMGLDYQRAEPQERNTIRAALAAFRMVLETRLKAFDSRAVLRTIVGALVLRDFDPDGFDLEGLDAQLIRQIRDN